MDRSPPPPLYQCYWNVSVHLWVAKCLDWSDYKPSDVAGTNFFYRWEAFTNDRCHIHFSQFRNALDDRDKQSRTLGKCRSNWKAFAKLHGLRYGGFIPKIIGGDKWMAMDAHVDKGLRRYCEKTMWGDEHNEYEYYKNRLGAMCNEWSFLASHLESEWGIFGGPKLQDEEKARRRMEMERDGKLVRLKRLEKATKTRDIKFLHDYDDKGYIRSYNSEYGKPLRKYHDYEDEDEDFGE